MKENDTIIRKEAIDALKAIKFGLWEIDIPHPGNCPEYIEHHKQIQEMMGVVDNWIERIKVLPTTEPTEEQVKKFCIRRNLALIAGEDMETIRQLFLPAEPRKWIPCSERLPSNKEHVDEMVLVCYGNGSIRFNTCMNGNWV